MLICCFQARILYWADNMGPTTRVAKKNAVAGPGCWYATGVLQCWRCLVSWILTNLNFKHFLSQRSSNKAISLYMKISLINRCVKPFYWRIKRYFCIYLICKFSYRYVDFFQNIEYWWLSLFSHDIFCMWVDLMLTRYL